MVPGRPREAFPGTTDTSLAAKPTPGAAAPMSSPVPCSSGSDCRSATVAPSLDMVTKASRMAATAAFIGMAAWMSSEFSSLIK